MFFDILLWTHIAASLTAFGLGLGLFFTPTRDSRRGAYNLLMGLLVVTAVSGIPLNTLAFSPFHALALLTLVNIPLSIRAFRQGRERVARDNLFQNYLGLSVALVGTTHPLRFIGGRMYGGTDLTLAETWFGWSMTLSIILVVVLLYLAAKDKLPYTRGAPKLPKQKT